MAKLIAKKILSSLDKTMQEYLAAISRVEESSDIELKQDASKIIKSVIVHEHIALDQIQN